MESPTISGLLRMPWTAKRGFYTRGGSIASGEVFGVVAAEEAKHFKISFSKKQGGSFTLRSIFSTWSSK